MAQILGDNETSWTPGRALAVLGIIALPTTILTLCGVGLAAPFGVALTVIVLWMTELVPLPVTALLVPVLTILFGITPVKVAFAPFGNEILALFLGCFLLSAAMRRHGFDRRLACMLIGWCAGRLTGRSLVMVTTATAFVLSMWISNTAATVIVVAIIAGILPALEERVEGGAVIGNLRLRLFIGAAFGASIGGIATPIGSPPNLIAVEHLRTLGHEPSFVGWLLQMGPLALVFLGVLFVIFEVRLPLPHLDLSWVRADFRRALSERGPLVGGEAVVAAVFVGAVGLWCAPDIVAAVAPESGVAAATKARLSLGSVGLIAGLLLFLIPYWTPAGWRPTLRWRDATEIDWGTIVLFGGGLALGDMLERTGAARAVGDYVVGLGLTEPFAILFVFVVLSVVLSEFASNTAAAAIMLPLIVGCIEALPVLAGYESALILAATVGASFGFMLPVSTPPNAVIYGTGYVGAGELRRTGVFFDLVGVGLVVLYFGLL